MVSQEFHEQVKNCIPCEFTMISAADDSEEAQEAYNTASFELPNPNGKEGGACTSSVLQVFYDNAHKMGKLTQVQVLKQMQAIINSKGFNQEPQLTSSRPIEADKPLYIVPPGSGRRRALLIGINYVGQQGELRAPHNDTNNLKDYLINVCGFDEKQMLILMDDGEHHMPTKKNIEAGFERLVRYSQPGDVVFISFSGHGGQVEDKDGDEEDGFDESLIPVDFRESGQIVDDDVLKYLIKPMAEGVHCTMIADACHSGTAADLPYKFGANDNAYETEPRFNMEMYDEIRAREKAENGEEDSHVEQKDYHPPPLPYNPEDGFIVRPAHDYSDEPGIKTQRPKEDLPPPPPQCCSIL